MISLCLIVAWANSWFCFSLCAFLFAFTFGVGFLVPNGWVVSVRLLFVLRLILWCLWFGCFGGFPWL